MTTERAKATTAGINRSSDKKRRESRYKKMTLERAKKAVQRKHEIARRNRSNARGWNVGALEIMICTNEEITC